MSSLITNPEYLSKDRLKSELKSHGIKFNQNENKQYYVNLYRKRIMDTEQSRYEFSSDEELTRPVKLGKKQQVQKRKKTIKMDTYLPGVLSLSDGELKEELESFGKDLGPILDSTRELYQRMLAKLMAENAVGKSAVSRSVQPRDSTEEDENEGAGHSESFVGEWSSGDSDEEEDTVEERPPPTPSPLKSPSQTKRRETGVRERSRRAPANKEEEEVEEPPPVPPEKQRVRSHRRIAPQSTSCQGFLVLLLMFTVAFFSYEHFTSSKEDLSLVTQGWRKAGCLWNHVKDYVVKSTPANVNEMGPSPTEPPLPPTEATEPPTQATTKTPPTEATEPPTTPPPTQATKAPTTPPPAKKPTQASPPPTDKPAAKKKPGTKKSSTTKTNGPK
ncbi:fibrous sheath CABYR-binding protein-like [Halichondria panicea]|uniref:fibrous sheath CABYR-binding protein-like n=1 Tax=Halichondria panicea TaxID=6063 RepID=UPI00312B647F